MCERERLRRQSCLFHHVNVVERHVCTKWLRWQGKSDLLAAAARLVCRCLRIKNLQAWLCLLAVLRVTLVSFKDCGLWRWLHSWRDTWRGYETLCVCDRQADLMRRKRYKSEILLYFDICRKVTAFGLVGFILFFHYWQQGKIQFCCFSTELLVAMAVRLRFFRLLGIRYTPFAPFADGRLGAVYHSKFDAGGRRACNRFWKSLRPLFDK